MNTDKPLYKFANTHFGTGSNVGYDREKGWWVQCESVDLDAVKYCADLGEALNVALTYASIPASYDEDDSSRLKKQYLVHNNKKKQEQTSGREPNP